MFCRGIRGAITTPENTEKQITNSTIELLNAIITANAIDIADIAAVFFTVTPDLNSSFPALAARKLGWSAVPLMCSQEIEVPGALSGCVRVMMMVNTDKPASEIRHIYLGEAIKLRPEFGPIDNFGDEKR